ncbi:VOC family protein [Mycolicibacterium sp. A43C]
MRTRWSGLTVDRTDPDRLAVFWGALLDRELEPGLPDWVQLRSRNEEPRISFQPVSDPKRGKVRIHLDVTVDDVDQAIERVLELGGRTTGERHEYPKGTVVVRILHRPLQHIESNRLMTCAGAGGNRGVCVGRAGHAPPRCQPVRDDNKFIYGD